MGGVPILLSVGEPGAAIPACGSTATRIEDGIQGRVDAMIWFKGINIFPSAVEAFEGVHAKVEILKEGTLPKTEYKGCRVRDNRTG